MAALKFFDRVLASSTTTGTGTLSLGAAQTGYRTFSGAGATSGDTVAYACVDDLSNPTNWEVGEGVWTSGSPETLTRATIRASSNGGSAVNWSAGTKYVFSASSAYRLIDALNVMSQGADVASASTIDLDAPRAAVVDITGTTTITAVTLAQGRWRIARFTGALTLTNGASLVLPGGANITTRAGDYALFVGYASGVVRVASYVRGNIAPEPQFHESVFTSSGTFTTPSNSDANTVYFFEMCGGGAGGGGSGASSNGTTAAGGGGGGEAKRGSFTGLAASTGLTITIGAAGTAGANTGGAGGSGGNTTIGTIGCVANGGSGGAGRNLGGGANGGAGGTGGADGTATILFSQVGQRGTNGVSDSTGGNTFGGTGGGSPLGLGLGGVATGYSVAGVSGTGFGAGGSGGADVSRAGGAGTAGFVRIWWVL